MSPSQPSALLSSVLAKVVGGTGLGTSEHSAALSLVDLGLIKNPPTRSQRVQVQWQATELGKQLNGAIRVAPKSLRVRSQHVTGSSLTTLERAAAHFASQLDELASELKACVKHSAGVELFSPPDEIRQLRETIAAITNPFVAGFRVELLDTAIFFALRGYLLKVKVELDNVERISSNPRVLDGFRLEIQNAQSMLAWEHLRGIDASPPRLTDYVGAATIAAVLERSSFPETRQPDEKFGILSAPGQYPSDYTWTMENAHGRGRSFALGFVDIDNFSEVNRAHKEAKVDRRILPRLMATLESYCFGRALAYRQGGDEYLVLVQNANEVEARSFFEGLREEISRIEYGHDIDGSAVWPITVSVGVHVVDGTSPITHTEALMLANHAKQRAKEFASSPDSRLKNRVEISNAEDRATVEQALLGG